MELQGNSRPCTGHEEINSVESGANSVLTDASIKPAQPERDEQAHTSRYRFRQTLQRSMDETLQNIFSNLKPLLSSQDQPHDEDNMRTLLEGVAQSESENHTSLETAAQDIKASVRGGENKTNGVRHLDAMSINLRLDAEHLLDKGDHGKSEAALSSTKPVLSMSFDNKCSNMGGGSNMSSSPCTNGTSLNDSPQSELLASWVSPYPRPVRPIKATADVPADDRDAKSERDTCLLGNKAISDAKPLPAGALKPDVSTTSVMQHATSLSPSSSCTTDRSAAMSSIANIYDVSHIAASLTARLPNARYSGSSTAHAVTAGAPASEFCTGDSATNINSSSTLTRDPHAATSCTTIDSFQNNNLSTTDNVGIAIMSTSCVTDKDSNNIHADELTDTYMNSSVPSITIVPSILSTMSGFDSSQKPMQISVTSHNKSTTSAGEPDDEAVRSNLFVCGLSPEVRDEELRELFAPYGEIESAKVMLDIHTGLSRCIAFVKFTQASSAAAALEKVSGSTVHGHQITVRIANSRAAYLPGNPTNKTFVRNVPLSVTRTELLRYFSKFGEVTDISIHTDTTLNRGNERDATPSSAAEVVGGAATGANERSAESKYNFVFVTFTTNESAAAAAAETHTKTPFPECNGVPLLAKVAEDSVRRIERLSRRYRTSRVGGGSPASGSITSMHSSTLTANASMGKSITIAGEEGVGRMMYGGISTAIPYTMGGVVPHASGNLLAPPAMMGMNCPVKGGFYVPTHPTSWGGLSGAGGLPANATWGMDATGMSGTYAATAAVPDGVFPPPPPQQQQHQQHPLYNISANPSSTLSAVPLGGAGADAGGMVYPPQANALPPLPLPPPHTSRQSAAVESSAAMVSSNPAMVYSVPPMQQQFMFVPQSQQQFPVQMGVMPQSYTVPVQSQPSGPLMTNVPGSVMYTPVNMVLPQCGPQQGGAPSPYYIVMNNP